MARIAKWSVLGMLLLGASATGWTIGWLNWQVSQTAKLGEPQVIYGGPYTYIRRLDLGHPRTAAAGPLDICPKNPRYFCNPAGHVVYLTGSHNWYNFKDGGKSDPPPRFNFGKYVDFLVSHNHNFIRLWTSELTKEPRKSDDNYYTNYFTPFPWLRTGPGLALDGKPKFDLDRLNLAYFDRLRSRIVAAGQKGIYVSVMLFEGNGIQFNRWEGDPLNARNNINGIDGDKYHMGAARQVDSLLIPEVTRIQEAYVRKVIDTVNDLDNVLYEVANEAGPYSTAWQYHMIRYVKAVEATKIEQHPVGMTFQYKGGSNGALFASPADWISPGPDSYKVNPVAGNGRKVILSDTDHLWGIGGDANWVWESFTRGLNPIYMDDLAQTEPRKEVRLAMGYARAYSNRIDLLNMAPRGDLASSGYCLARPGVEYLAYTPAGGAIVMQLDKISTEWNVEWFNPSSGEVYEGGIVQGANLASFRAPFSGPAVLHLQSASQTRQD